MKMSSNAKRTAQFAIIARYGEDTAVHYYKGTLEGAQQEAISTQRIGAADSVTYAMVCGFVDCDGNVSMDV